MYLKPAITAALLAALFSAAQTQAQSGPDEADKDRIVLLENPEKGVYVLGELLELTDDAYKVRTSVGDLWIPVAQVVCTGARCPNRMLNAGSSSSAAAFAVAGSDTIGSN